MRGAGGLLALLLGASQTGAQLGPGWVRYAPRQVVHLADGGDHSSFPWGPHAAIGNPPKADYSYDSLTETETFKLYGRSSNRSEIRLYNEYRTGSRQFEGYVTFSAPLDDESLMQIWGSDAGATQMMIRGMADNGGSFGINHSNRGTPRFRSGLYGKEVKVNVIHLQEDVGNRIQVFLDDQKVLDFPDNERVTNHDGNYHKYGCYGTVRAGHESPVVQWRKVRHYMNGRAPGELTGIVRMGSLDRRGEREGAGRPLIYRSGLPVFDMRGRTVFGATAAPGSIPVLGPGSQDGADSPRAGPVSP